MPGVVVDELKPIVTLTTVESVRQARQQTDVLAAGIEQQLEDHLAEALGSASENAKILDEVATLASSVSEDADELTSILRGASQTAEGACDRLRHLDAVITRADAALKWADDTLTLRVCAEGAKTSLSADDLSSAARHIEQYLKLSDAVRQDQANVTSVSQIEQSMSELSRKVRERAHRLLQPDADLPVQSAVDAVSLFVPIGEADDGLAILTEFFRNRVARESDSDVRTLIIETTSDESQPGGFEEPHIVALARLFEAIAAYVHESDPLLLNLFSHNSRAHLIEGLQKQCDACAERILTRYKEARGLPEVLRALRSETANARDLDPLLNELALVSQRISRYFNFLLAKGSWPEDATVTDEERGALLERIETALAMSGLAKHQKELASIYTAVEAYFMTVNARLAIKIDESSGDEAETSTAVDDFFFVLQKCFERAFAYGDTDCDVLRIVLQQISHCLSNDLLTYMRRRLRETEAALEKMLGGSSAASALPSAGLAVSYLTELAKANISMPGTADEPPPEADTAKYDFFVTLNNAAVSGDYATRLRANVEKAMQVSRKLTSEDRAVLGSALAQITDASRALVLAAEHGISSLSSVLLGRITELVEHSLRRASYIVTEAEYSLDSDATPSFSREVAQELETKVLSDSLEKRLTEKNWDALVRQVAEWFARKMETIVFLPGTSAGPSLAEQKGKPFNAFGGLRADRDVRAISSYFSGKSKRSTVRDVFSRLSQLAMLVNLERPAEIYDMWGANAGGMTWRLTPNEVQATLSLRTDFSADAVKSLKL